MKDMHLSILLRLSSSVPVSLSLSLCLSCSLCHYRPVSLSGCCLSGCVGLSLSVHLSLLSRTFCVMPSYGSHAPDQCPCRQKSPHISPYGMASDGYCMASQETCSCFTRAWSGFCAARSGAIRDTEWLHSDTDWLLMRHGFTGETEWLH